MPTENFEPKKNGGSREPPFWEFLSALTSLPSLHKAPESEYKHQVQPGGIHCGDRPLISALPDRSERSNASSRAGPGGAYFGQYIFSSAWLPPSWENIGFKQLKRH
jgi:hypothetical protein